MRAIARVAACVVAAGSDRLAVAEREKKSLAEVTGQVEVD